MSQSIEKKRKSMNDERGVRIRKLLDLREQGIDAYPSHTERTHTIHTALSLAHGTVVTLVGRLVSKREMGKLIFAHLEDSTGRIQLVIKQNEIGKDLFSLVEKRLDTADFLQASGERFVTQKGEESILVKDATLLCKSLRPLPDQFYGLKDEETRLRKRYLDLLAHPELKNRFMRKAVFWQSMRTFLRGEGYIEVETPVLETMPGGADATPFKTHLNALDIDVYLRISMGELWQKRLMVAGFEKTFEIGRQFRNEGMSREHLQDYTQLEFYWAYADYADGMIFFERLYKHVLKETFGTLMFHTNGFKNIDLSKKWKTIEYAKEIQKQTGLDVLEATEDELRETLSELGLSFQPHDARGRLMDVVWKHCRKQVKGPVFLTNIPVEVSPLAKRLSANPKVTERFQVIIAGTELGNGYSELNDPIEQAARFEEQTALREAGDTEAQFHDKDFVEALEHGMPPACGFGLSERLFSVFEGRPIRECVLFPLMKPLSGAGVSDGGSSEKAKDV